MEKDSKIRYRILFIVFFITALSFADRATVSIAGEAISEDFQIDGIMLGYIFSAFSWTYVLAQIPGGILVDRFGPKIIHTILMMIWTVLLFSHGATPWLPIAMMAIVFIILRALTGLVSAPMFSVNSRVVAEWFPIKERAFATSIYTSAQYLSVVLFAPIFGFISMYYSWSIIFFMMAIAMGLVLIIWMKYFRLPFEHPKVSLSERSLINQKVIASQVEKKKIIFDRQPVRQLLTNQMTVGIYIGQYCSAVVNYFFMTWFPLYLIDTFDVSIYQTSLYMIFPASGAFLGSLLAGYISDRLIAKGYSHTFSRKLPITIGLLASSLIVCLLWIQSVTVAVICITIVLWGRGFSGLGWTLITETVSKQFIGIHSGIFNTFSNLAGIITPIVIGFLFEMQQNFNGAIIFICAHCLLAIVSYHLLVKEIREFEIKYRVLGGS
ncbi:MFS transporter [Lysinibacillus telephonicus]|uniref:MFS transporter n=1 Tax=Lysinibacillus telephonicus TaxID=1714840 RepID=UPI0037D9537E